MDMDHHHHKDDSETEGSHGSHTDAPHLEEGDAHYSGGYPVVRREGKDIVSPPPKNTILYCLGVVVLLVLVVVLPSTLIDRNKGNNNDDKEVALQQQQDENTPAVVYDTFEYTAVDNEQCPGHVMNSDDEYWEVMQVYALGMVLGERDMARTFDVEPLHTVLDDQSGVVFNVETVSEALPENLEKPILTSAQVYEVVHAEAGEFYQNATEAMYYPQPPLPNVTLEVQSNHDNVVYAGGQGFLAACMMAFAQHLPLALTPDHLWTIIAQGFARHVDQHPEELRHHFVDHDGKKEIRIREDTMVRGESPPEQWEELIFPKFSDAIGDNMNNEEAYNTLSGQAFSTSTATTQAASEIVLMAAMKSYFEYTMVTACGIPKVRLEGTRDDWVNLKTRTEKLAQWMMPNTTHGELWITDIVVPILEQFIQAYDGHVNYCFWQTMVKFRTTGGGSGSFEFLSGWLPTLFPYLSVGGGRVEPNPHLRHWEESASAHLIGPQPNQIPSQISSVPVMWEYYFQEFPLHFHAGFRGVTQEADGTLAPVLGWYVTNDPE